MRWSLDGLIRRFLVTGSLTVRYPDGGESVHVAGPGRALTVEVRSWRAVWGMLANPAMAFGEAITEGDIVPVDGSLYDLLDLLVSARFHGARQPVMALHEAVGRATKRWAQFNPAIRARRNVAHHYDLNAQLYALLLDRDRQYSCAYFPRGDETLDEAQAAKKRHIAAKLLLTRPGLRVLEIGSGWGGMALTLAREYGADVTGITLSREQLATSRARAEAEGLADRVRFELLDYRSVRGTFDRVVSVGMFEHVGVTHYRRFFEVVQRSLAPDGVALVHAIGRSYGPSITNPWLAKYVFPGGYSPALSEVLPAAERSGLVVTDLEILRLHYAKTLRLWRGNLERNWEAIAALADERFCRMFEFYLASAEVAFRQSGHMVWQMQVSQRGAPVPLTRNYMATMDAPLPA
ncbi:MAG: cyclopropane-fatty-acyl-phospholipid synthase family protein [Acetobacteraceae bacterium]